jgi:type II secretory pathway component PulM
MARLKPREKRTLVVGGVSLMILMMLWYFFLWDDSLWMRWRSVRDRIELRDSVLRKMKKLRREYLILDQKIGQILARMEDQDQEMARKGFLEKIISENAPGAELNRMTTKVNIIHDLYRETEISVKLSRVNLPELVDVLYGIESEGGSLKLRELAVDIVKKEPDLLDVEFKVITAEPLAREEKKTP